jgi:hypothetical protein
MKSVICNNVKIMKIMKYVCNENGNNEKPMANNENVINNK